ncbi:MAG: cupin domain-containing protein [Sulfobacillus sp.]|nr:cupin domain-containing protein [Sulfobacillus sp.]
MTADPYEAIDALGAAPLWRYYGNLFPPEPVTAAVPFLWRYEALRPYMLHFAEALSLKEAERRVLMLVNPGLKEPPATVNNLYAGIQIILPGETAQAHRHSANAFRFIIEGEGAYTTVNGERVHMHPGDFLLTPGWHWHDHSHEGQGPMMWLDGLDYPLVNKMEAAFFELLGERLQTPTVPDDQSQRLFIHGRLTPRWLHRIGAASPIGNYPWSETEKAFEAIGDSVPGSPVDGIVLEYTNPWTGGPVMPTMSCRISRLRPGFSGQPFRHTASTIFHVVRGHGITRVNGVDLHWGPHDVFAVPGWSVYRHENLATDEDAVLFHYSDEPAQQALGLYRVDDRPFR